MPERLITRRKQTWLAIGATTFFCACTWHNVEDLTIEATPPPLANEMDCPPISLEAEVLPIIETNCTVAGCHVVGTSLPHFETTDQVIAFAVQIDHRIRHWDMPPRPAEFLAREDMKTIQCWVQQGALDN
ncbi:MAG TPA: hypothetical protein DCE41_14755 [Cytophagales bacterium]|nr:hypothetical protein [Cytophagales bacterium]HAA17849.1 hypothetical protein [Cytophagales bacterium]HAP58230.1 hypothetical protein [Cytophagales bacterium]